MKIAVIGLGIIGGSFCKAIKKHTDHTVMGINRTPAVAEQALKDGSIDVIGTKETLGEADIIFLCMYPQACVDFIKEYGKYIKKGTLVTDSSGIKRAICPELKKLSEEFGFIFVGSHPMAGKEKNGYGVSEAELFKGASFIITPCGADPEYGKKLAELALSIGFGQIKITTPEEHDRMIAFTSQLPSYRDVSRVANINSKLWTELFLENREPLTQELDILINNITSIKNAIENEDKQTLEDLLEQGHRIKQSLGE